MRRPLTEQGAALSAAIILIVILMAMAASILSLAYNQQRLINESSRGYTKAYFAAQAGVVNAQWRIRANYTADIGGGSFLTSTFDPAPYFIDLQTNAIHTTRTTADDVIVDIGPVNTTTGDPLEGLRTIVSQGIS